MLDINFCAETVFVSDSWCGKSLVQVTKMEMIF